MPRPRAKADTIDTTATEKDPQHEAFTNFLASIGKEGHAGKVRVFRVVDGDRKTIPGAVFDAATFSDLDVADKYGGGRYYAQFTNPSGSQFGRGATFEVLGAPKAIEPPAPAQQQPPPETLGEAIGKAVAAAMAPLIEQVRTVEHRIQAFQPGKQERDPIEMLKTAADIIHGKAQTAQPQGLTREDIQSIIRTALPENQFGTLMGMARQMAGEMTRRSGQSQAHDQEGSGEDMGGIIRQAAGEFFRVLNERRARQGQQSAPQPQQPQQLQGQGVTQGPQPVTPPALPPEQVAMLAIIRAQVRDRPSGNDDTPTAAASIISVMGEADALQFAKAATDPNAAGMIEYVITNYAPDLAAHRAHVEEIARAIVASLEESHG